MGKRKERRLAAMNATGRRVKLDLFAEPSGDLGGSSQDGVRGQRDSNNHAELPNSPSSSDHQPENPLMLLGQYSDDECDGDSSEGHIHTSSEDSLGGHDDQVKVSSREEKNDAKGVISSAHINNEDEAKENDSASDNILQRSEECMHKESNVVEPAESLTEMDEMNQNTTSGTFDPKIALDEISGWKVVLHEESNQYYYWNVSTGETSWEVPITLIPTTELGKDKKATNDIGVEDVKLRKYEYHANLNTKPEDSNCGETCDGSSNNHEHKMEMFDGGCKYNALQGKGVDVDANLSAVKKLDGQLDSHNDIFPPVGDSLKQSRDDALSGHLGESGVHAEKHVDVSAGESKIESDFSSNLVEHCESLLHKLKTMQVSKKCMQGHDQISKYMLEVDIRLADIRSLACNGLSLLPFWVHSEKRLKLLEAAVDEISVLSNSFHSCEADALRTSHHEITDETEVDPNGTIAIHHSCRKLYAAEYAGSPESRKDVHVEAFNDGTTTNSGSNAVEEGELVEPESYEEFASKAVHPEEVDMDVDMEVEDAPPCDSIIGDASFGQNHLAHEKDMVQAFPSNEGSSLMELASIVPPPPPDEDWIPPPPPDEEPFPPPPPDEEPFPPPPPDEPPETTYSHPSDLQSVQPFPYTVSYPVSGYEFYSQMNNVAPTCNIYSHAEGQVAVSHEHLYYEAVTNAYSSDPMTVNAVNSGAYYGFQGGSAHHVPVLVAADSSVHPSGLINEETLSGPTGSFGTHIEVSSVLPIQNQCDGVIDVGTAGISLNFPAAQATLQGSNTVFTPENPLASSISSITAPTNSIATASNIPSKVSRHKKRTVAVGLTLRSNKKVSNLVDKWKAAKEELNADEEEDEPASAYEILEKKRQREIEEWRAKQIASGEAKDNANFQPLGGDWRERVKRRRAEQMKKAKAEQRPSDGAGEGQQPDLNALSTGLPSGWQVYWDESSKQVYYGNVTTSETTWTRPTN